MKDLDEKTCWYKQFGVEGMNAFFDKHKNDMEVQKHLFSFVKLLEATDEKGNELLDLGAGTGLLSKFCNEYKYSGADLAHILAGCTMRNYPDFFYRKCDIINDDLNWIKPYPVVVLNAVIDVMQNPLEVLEKILRSSSKYVIIHRQEITEKGKTHTTQEGSYGGYTYHSKINRADFNAIIERCGFSIVRELQLEFSNWENNGSSFLLRKKKTWALYDIDIKLDEIFGRKENGFFIEAGANDGITQSNTMFFEFHRNWKGILIEPIKEIYEKCVQNRSANTICLNYALAGDELKTEAEIAWSKESNGLLGFINEGEVSEKLRKMQITPSIEIIKSKAKCLTLNSIIESYAPNQKIDLLILDLEGYEWEVLKSFDFEKHKIEYLLIEELEGDDTIGNYLDTCGYGRIHRITDHDFLYKRRA